MNSPDRGNAPYFSPPGKLRKPASPMQMESPPGRIAHHNAMSSPSPMSPVRAAKPPPPPRPLILTGKLHVEVKESFEDGTQDKAYFAWESRVKRNIAEKLGLPEHMIQITGVAKGDQEHQELLHALHIHDAQEKYMPTDSHELTAEHLEMMRSVFDKMVGSDGKINARSFIKAVKADPTIAQFLHLPMRSGKGSSNQSLLDRFRMMDTDGSKTVDFEEFVTFFGMTDEEFLLYRTNLEQHHDSLRAQHLSPQQQADVRKLFSKFDPEYHGYISRDEFNAHYHKGLPLWGVINRNGSEYITLNEFINFFDRMHGGTMTKADFWRHLSLAKSKKSPTKRSGSSPPPPPTGY